MVTHFGGRTENVAVSEGWPLVGGRFDCIKIPAFQHLSSTLCCGFSLSVSEDLFTKNINLRSRRFLKSCAEKILEVAIPDGVIIHLSEVSA